VRPGAASSSQAGRPNGRRGAVKGYLILGLVLAAAAVALTLFPEKQDAARATTVQYLREMVTILPAVMVIMGLFSVFVSKDLVVRHMGRTSRAKGMLIAIVFGALPTGPLYVAFPLAVALRKKGASIANVVVFLSAWACIKIPQELFELQFLGFEFMLTRLVLTIAFVVAMALFVEKAIEWSERRELGVPEAGAN
jgi:uncharacterized membrane protein YraQ (UPF0718 family)